MGLRVVEGPGGGKRVEPLWTVGGRSRRTEGEVGRNGDVR